ncbi:hypothetical protein Tco_0814189 [Tanacetum coccineum]
MAEMFGPLKELTSSRTPKKVLVREEARHSITKNVNAISLIKMENEKGAKGDKVAERNVMELKELDALGSIESPDKGEGIDGGIVKDMKEEITKRETKAEVLLETLRSRHIGNYLKHEINKKLIEGLIDNHKYNYSFLTTRLGKDNETHDYFPKGPLYNAIRKKNLVKRDDMEGTFVIPCSIGGVKYGTITLKSSKNKIDFVKVPAFPSEIKERTDEDLDPVTLTNTVSRLILEWGERIKPRKDKEMEFNQWRSKVFNDERSALVNEGYEVIFDKKKLWSS